MRHNRSSTNSGASAAQHNRGANNTGEPVAAHNAILTCADENDGGEEVDNEIEGCEGKGKGE